jgi:hypothetical protein
MLLAGIGAPVRACARADAIRVGHLTARAGRLGPLGDHAVMGVQLAAEEINAAGGVHARRIALLLEDASDPHAARARAARLITRDKVAVLIGHPDRCPHVFRAADPDTDMPAAFVAAFAARYGKTPEPPAWRDYRALKLAARAIDGTR